MIWNKSQLKARKFVDSQVVKVDRRHAGSRHGYGIGGTCLHHGLQGGQKGERGAIFHFLNITDVADALRIEMRAVDKTSGHLF